MDIQIKPIQKPDNTPALSETLISFDNKNVAIIGREPQCDIVLDCNEKVISRQHAQISRQGNALKLTDISANGTFINTSHKPIGKGNSALIHDNDLIRLGDYVLKVTIFPDNPPQNNPLQNNDGVSSERNHNNTKNNPNAKPVTTSISEKKAQQTNSKATRNDIAGHTRDRFLPPKAVIPEDWDAPLLAPNNQGSTQLPEKLASPISFSEQDKVLLESLLKGLGIKPEDASVQLTSDNMLALGRCLRSSLAGIIKQQNLSDKIKSKLCFDDNSMLKSLNYTAFAGFKSSEAFLKQLLSTQQETHSEFPLEIAKTHNELMEDQITIFKSYNKAIDAFRDELSPFTIEKIYKERQKNSNFTNKIVPSIGKWEIYKKQWSVKSLNLRKLIKKNFEESINALHKKRINERQVISKNKK